MRSSAFEPFFLSEGAAGLGVGATIIGLGLVASASTGAGATSSVAAGSSAGVESASFSSVAAFFRGWTLMPLVFFRYLRCDAVYSVRWMKPQAGQRCLARGVKGSSD